MSLAEDMVKEEIKDRPWLTMSDIITPRLRGDVLREIAAHAFLRTAYMTHFKDIDVLRYDHQDMDFILRDPYHFVEFLLEPIIAAD